jgi:hypothetical protein
MKAMAWRRKLSKSAKPQHLAGVMAQLSAIMFNGALSISMQKLAGGEEAEAAQCEAVAQSAARVSCNGYCNVAASALIFTSAKAHMWRK